MPLPTGHRLGHFEILSLLGQGGMGEVYKARDTRLDRIVAIKVSHAEFSERFTREAKVISSLNHPNICALYDVGSQDGLHYLVMEYLEGKPLEGPLPPDKLQRYGIEIAAALDAAHRKGVTHRDLKPDNIMVTASGIKLLDFGLAKTAEQPGPMDATVRKALTQEGVVMGTFPYMAPEQLEGKEADARTDIWAFGAVLYEMASGERAFGGNTQATVIASIMHVAPPPVKAPGLDRIIRRALQRDPEERWQSARDLLIELRELTAPVPPPIPGTASAAGMWRWVAIAAGIAAVALAGALVLRKPEPPQKVHMEIIPPADMLLGSRVSRISPDGRKLLLSMGPAGAGAELYVRYLDSPTFNRLDGTRSTIDAAWSPDSSAIAYLSHGELQRVQVDGSLRQTLASIKGGEGVAWGDIGILVGQQKGPLLLVPASGGAPVPATQLDPAGGHTSHSGPYMLPDRKRFTFRVEGSHTDAEGIYVGSVDGPIRKVPGLNQTRNFAGFVSVIANGGTIARAMDWEKLTLGGEAISLPSSSMASISDNGSLFYVTRSPVTAAGSLKVVSRSGAPLLNLSHPDAKSYDHPEFSPDGRRILFETGNQLWVVDLARKAFSVLNKELFTWAGSWSPDGRTVLFSSRGQIWEVPVDGGEPVRLGAGAFHHIQAIGPREVIGDVGPGGTGNLLQHLTFGASRTSRTLLSEPAQNPQLSPNRKWLAYDRFAGDRRSLFLQSWPDGKLTIPVPDGGGSWARWRGDGKELFFHRSSGAVVALPVIDKGDTLEFGTITTLHERGASHFAVSADGQTFAYGTQNDRREADAKIHVIVNWRGGK